MRDKWLNYVIILLVVLAVGLGAAIATQYGNGESDGDGERLFGLKFPSFFTNSASDSETQEDANTVSISTDQNTSLVKNRPSSDFAIMKKEPLTTKEEQAINHPGPDANTDELIAHSELINELAVRADFLDISGCDARPVVMNVSLGEEFVVRNTDTVDRVIVIDADHIFTIPASSEIALTAEFGKQGGIYGYGCNETSSAVGMFLVSD